VEETTVHRTLIQNMIPRTEPMSYLARVTGGLGVSLGYALGAKLAMKERPVFVLIGDGGFHYNPVPSCLGLAQEYNLPIIVVVFNNQRYLSMERGLLKYYPDGVAKKTGVHFGGPILPNPDYRLYAEIYGGYGVRVTDPKNLQPAVAKALEHSAAGRLSVIDVVLSDYQPRQ
jgi:acetolactate synthase-1/2/3 large subunit